MSRGTIQNPTQSQDFHFVQVLFIQNHSFLFELIRVLSSAWMSFHTTRKQSDWFISNAFRFQNQELFTSNYLKFQPKIGMKMVKWPLEVTVFKFGILKTVGDTLDVQYSFPKMFIVLKDIYGL